jgi:hypothetical protein
MADSRRKGAAYERQVAARLHGLTGITFKRDLDQYRASEHGDLTADDPAWPFALECKRYASGTGCKPAWRAQATAAAGAVGKFPAVIFRFDRLDDRVSVPIEAIAAAFGETHTDCTEWAEITIEGLAYLAAEIMAKSVIHVEGV